MSRRLVLCLLVLTTPALAPAAEPWTTFRGNVQRTGCVDGRPGPTAPKVLWVHRSQDHYIAAPVPAGDSVFVSGMGAFNVPTFQRLASDPAATQRVLWAKSTPALKLPTVSSPAVIDGKLFFGDGMHQTDGAALHCLRLERGLPLWELQVPGRLVHLEGSPTVAGNRLYLGGGAAGVLCVETDRVTLDGKSLDLPAVQKVLDAKWTELQARYEADKKKDPDFAIPPSEDQLPKPAPARVWQQGQERWHVDAPLAVVGDSVLAASAFLDKEQVGDRALFCLNARDGSIRWRVPLTLNPWGGPSVQGDTVIVTGSSIGFDPKALSGAKGSIAAYSLADGKEKWRKTVPGGVPSCAALTAEAAIVTATDGKVRAFDLATGERRWIHEAGTPFFAPPAVAGDVVYVGDLKGNLLALNRADGRRLWNLDLGAHPDVKAPGMIYAGPALEGGRLFVATCNLEGPFARQPTVVICLGDR